jgi:hypothetical protein
MTALMAQDGKDLLLKEKPGGSEIASFERSGSEHERSGRRERGDRERAPRAERSNEDKPVRDRESWREGPREGRRERSEHAGTKEVPADMERFRIDVGHVNDIKPGNIVGAIANEADLDSQYIGHIKIHDEYSTVDLPKGMPKATLEILRKARVAGRPMNLRLMESHGNDSEHNSDKKPFVKKFSKGSSERSSSPFKKEGFKKEGFRKESSERSSSPFKKDSGFKKDFKKSEGGKPAFKKDGFKKGGFKKKRSSDD